MEGGWLNLLSKSNPLCRCNVYIFFRTTCSVHKKVNGGGKATLAGTGLEVGLSAPAYFYTHNKDPQEHLLCER